MRRIVVVALVVVAGCGTGDTSERTEAAMDDMWSQRSQREQLALCAEMRLKGLAEVVNTFMDAEPDFDEATVRSWWVEACG